MRTLLIPPDPLKMPPTAIDQFDELPRTEGPKLLRFNDGPCPEIEYLEHLSNGDNEDQSKGYVFKVRIDEQLYALKIVCLTVRLVSRK